MVFAEPASVFAMQALLAELALKLWTLAGVLTAVMGVAAKGNAFATQVGQASLAISRSSHRTLVRGKTAETVSVKRENASAIMAGPEITAVFELILVQEKIVVMEHAEMEFAIAMQDGRALPVQSKLLILARI
jgi:hypothetical protein